MAIMMTVMVNGDDTYDHCDGEPAARAVASWKQQKDEREWRSFEMVSNLQKR